MCRWLVMLGITLLCGVTLSMPLTFRNQFRNRVKRQVEQVIADLALKEGARSQPNKEATLLRNSSSPVELIPMEKDKLNDLYKLLKALKH